MKSIFIGLSSHASYTADEEISVLLEISNRTPLPIHILSWSLPGEELTEDCFRVYKHRKLLRYDGKLVKRIFPRPEDFVQLAPGMSIIRKIVLNKAYPVAQKGKFTAAFKPERLIWLTGQPSSRTINQALKAIPKHPKGIKVQEKAASFIVEPGKKTQTTLGQQARTLEKKRAVRLRSAEGPQVRLTATEDPRGARPPIIMGSSPTIPAPIVEQAHQQACLIALNALQDLSNGISSTFTTWFGDPAQLGKVRGNFNRIIKDLQNVTFTYDLSGTDCSPTAFAHTFPGTTTIFICPAFGGLPANGLESRAGCILHEHSHASADTLDFKSGPAACRNLAISHPDQAAGNADSYAFFSTSL